MSRTSSGPKSGRLPGTEDVGKLFHDEERDIWYECVFDQRQQVFTWTILPQTKKGHRRPRALGGERRAPDRAPRTLAAADTRFRCSGVRRAQNRLEGECHRRSLSVGHASPGSSPRNTGTPLSPLGNSPADDSTYYLQEAGSATPAGRCLETLRAITLHTSTPFLEAQGSARDHQ